MAFLDYPGLQRFTNKIKSLINGLIGNSDMGTTADTITGAIAEHTSRIQNLEAVEPVKAVNHVEPDSTGNVSISTVDYAVNLVADDAQSSFGEFIARTSGGDASISDGDAWLSSIRGRSVHVGYSPNVVDWDVAYGDRSSGDPISIAFDEDVFLSYVSESGSITLSYTNQWNENPALYGFTITGTPVNGDTISVQFTKEARGTITTATPTSFVSVGWNLFNYVTGYARVLKYSDVYGFRVGGAYTVLQFSETINGPRSSITVVNGAFTIPSDGYVWVSGGDNTSTYICMTWSDWIDGPEYDWTGYETDTIDLTSVMTYFPYGLCQVGTFADSIDFNLGVAMSYINRIEYTDENLEEVKESGQPYNYDENYIYVVKTNPDTYNFTIDGSYIVSDHGLEMFTDTSVDIYTSMLYGQDLKNKLRRDVVTISQMDLNDDQKSQVRQNIDAQKNMAFSDITSSAWMWGSAYAVGDSPAISFLAYGNIRMLRLTISPKNAQTTWTTIGYIAEGHKPPHYLSAYAAESKTSPTPKHVRIKPDGTCEIFARAVSTYSINFIWFVML